MKKILCGLLVCSLLFVTACGGDKNSAVDDVLSEKIAAEEELKAEVEVEIQEEIVVEETEDVIAEEVVEVVPEVEVVEEVTPEPEVIPEPEPIPEVVEEVVVEEVIVEETPSILERQIDVDLTKLSAIMVYAEVFNIVMNPAEYEGMVIKMNGPCFIYDNPDTGESFYAVIIQDATACCTQGLEFILADGAVKPNDYPPADEMITVVGEVEVFEDFGMTFCRIVNGVVL